MRSFLAFVLVLVLSLPFVSCSDSDRLATLLGTWEANLEHADGSKTQITTIIREDGTLERKIQFEGSLEATLTAGTWNRLGDLLVMEMSDGSAWRDKIVALDQNVLYVKCTEGRDEIRRGTFMGSHRK